MRKEDIPSVVFETLERTTAQGRCHRRKIGCILTYDDFTIVAAGWNSPPPFDVAVCNCPGKDVPAGAGASTSCYAIHAEEWAIEYARFKGATAEYAFCSKAPCASCVRQLYLVGVEKIFFLTPSNEKLNEELAGFYGIEWVHLQ